MSKIRNSYEIRTNFVFSYEFRTNFVFSVTRGTNFVRNSYYLVPHGTNFVLSRTTWYEIRIFSYESRIFSYHVLRNSFPRSTCYGFSTKPPIRSLFCIAHGFPHSRPVYATLHRRRSYLTTAPRTYVCVCVDNCYVILDSWHR